MADRETFDDARVEQPAIGIHSVYMIEREDSDLATLMLCLQVNHVSVDKLV